MPIWRRTSTGSTPGPYRSLAVELELALHPAPGITSCMRLSDRRKVDLPQPDGPMKAVTDLGSTAMLTPSTARK